MMVRRGIGVLMLLVGISGVVASVVGARLGYKAVDAIGGDLAASLSVLIESLDTVGDSLSLAQSSVVDVNASLDSLEEALTSLSTTVDETQPLLEELGSIASEDVPDSVEAMQEAFPGMSQVAGVIDDTLATLNRFRIDEQILGLRIQYDLGIDYDPSIPFDESVDQIGRSLDGLPDRLRGLQVQVETTSENLETVSQNVDRLAGSISEMNERIEEAGPLIEEYSRIVTEINDSARRIKRDLAKQVSDAKLVVTILMIWLGLSQIAPLYLGFELITSKQAE